jgi:hypothetical protein
MHKLTFIILILVFLIMILPNKTECFDTGLLESNEESLKKLITLVLSIVNTNMDKLKQHDKIISEVVLKHFDDAVKEQNPEKRKEVFTQSMYKINYEPDAQSKPTKNVFNLKNFNPTIDFMYWELRSAGLKTDDKSKIVKMALLYDQISEDEGLKKLFKPTGQVRKTISTLLSNYNYGNNTINITLKEINDLL